MRHRLLARADGFDVVAVGIEQERRVVRRAVVLAQPRTAVVAAARLDASPVEAIDRASVRCPERDVHAGVALSRGIEPERRLSLRAEPGAGVVARADDVSESLQRLLVEADARVEVLHFQADVIEHGDLLVGAHPAAPASRRSWRILRSPRAARRNCRGETPAARWNERTKFERSANPTS